MAKKKRTTKARATRSTPPTKGAALSESAVMTAVKRMAAKQPITISLTEEQAQSILEQWRDNPRLPARITFKVGTRKISEFAVASYRYRGDTCCVCADEATVSVARARSPFGSTAGASTRSTTFQARARVSRPR